MQSKPFTLLSLIAVAALLAMVLQPHAQNWVAAQAKLVTLKAELADAQAQVQALREDNTELQQSVARRDRALSKAQDAQHQLTASLNAKPATVLCCVDGRLLLHFRNDSTTIEPFYDTALVDFADAVRTLPGAIVEINGYADHSGERDANLELSQERVQAVQERLRSLGLREVAFHTAATGTAAPFIKGSEEDANNAFFERRVELRLINAGSQQVSMR
jgi:outer membrane protein OmpA-like peptidoglycan-associated protein